MSLKESLGRLLPFELKRGTSLISIVITAILAGFLGGIGDLIAKGLVEIIPKTYPFLNRLVELLFLRFELNVLTLLIGLFLIFPVYRFVDRLLLKRKEKELIYEDRFTTNAGWFLNYWGTTNPSKTNRIEDSGMVFEAIAVEVVNQERFYGAFYDLRNGIYQGNIYRVICLVKSANAASMAFQLWLHDTAAKSDVKAPERPTTPRESGDEVSCDFKATETNALRIHLHCRGGSGRIIVEKVSVFKIR